jgi:hypothetical protein
MAELWGLLTKSMGTPFALEVHASLLFGWEFSKGFGKGSMFVSYFAGLARAWTPMKLERNA